MKTSIVLTCLLLGSAVGRAAFHDFNWFAEGFVLRQDSVDTGELEPYNPIGIGDSLGGNVLFALYFTPGPSTQQLAPTVNVGSGPVIWSGQIGDPGGDDRLVKLVRANEALGGGGFDLNISTDYLGNTLSSITNEVTGYFYSVALEFDDAAVDPLDANTWNVAVPENTFSFITAAVSMTYYDASDTPSPSFLSATAGGTWVGEDDGTAGSAVANTVLIPEPGTLILFSLFGLVGLLGLRTFRKRT